MNRSEKTQEIIENIWRMHRLVDASVWQKTGLSRAQISMLYVLYYHKCPSMGQIAFQLGVSRSAITQLIDPLIVTGMVTRLPSPSDRRIAVLSLSPKGRRLISDLNRHKAEGLRTAIDALSDKDLDMLYQLHTKVALSANRKAGIN